MSKKTTFIDELNISPTLAANEIVGRLRAEGRDIYHMGFGQAPFPVHERLSAALIANANQKAYLPVSGLKELRDQILKHQAKHTSINPDDFEVMISPGSKLILFALQMAIKGDLLLPTPSWVSYAPQAKLLNSNIIPLKTKTTNKGYELTSQTLEQTIAKAKTENLNPTKLLINFPSNPTGLTISNDTLQEISEICKKHNITLISDEIYGRLSFDQSYRSAASSFPEGTIITSGLSKHLSLGGWRLGFCMFPKSMIELKAKLEHIASETWSCVASPIQFAAIEAYKSHPDIEAFIKQSTNIHAAVNIHIAKSLNNLGVTCPIPQGGFYNWPDFSNLLDHKFKTSSELSNTLLEDHGLVTLPGTAFGEAPENLRLRLSGCDYDGQQALDHFKSCEKTNSPLDIQSFAPNVQTALTQFENFLDQQ